MTYLYPNDLDQILIPSEVFDHYGLGSANGICTPAHVLARTLRVAHYELTGRCSLTQARLGDSQKEGVESIEHCLPESGKRLWYAKPERKGLGGWLFPKQKEVMLPPVLDFKARQVGHIPIGLAGELEVGANGLPRAMDAIEKMALETSSYFEDTRYDVGVALGVCSLGGTEIFNRALTCILRDRHNFKPVHLISIWILGEHPNAKALTAWRLKAGLRAEELVLLRINSKGDLKTWDYNMARAASDILSQFGLEGEPDLSTILQNLKEKGNRYALMDAARAHIPLRRVYRATGMFGHILIRKELAPMKEKESVVKSTVKSLSFLARSENPTDCQYYFVHGPISKNEAAQIKKSSRSITESPVVVVPAGGLTISVGDRLMAEAWVIRIRTNKRSISEINALFNIKKDPEPAPTPNSLIPKDLVEDAIEKAPKVRRGLEAAARFLRMDLLDFVRGGDTK